ncbi:dihydroneopterin aldolase [bacterium]|nr:MAG: dihydroneopterin aldolase [bacterium]
MDQILIKDLLVRGVIGITDRERERPQDIVINIVLFTDISQAALSDAITDCIDYSAVAKKVFSLVENAHTYTVEALAARVASLCLAQPLVKGVRVRVEKPGAVRFSRSVGCEIERFNP